MNPFWDDTDPWWFKAMVMVFVVDLFLVASVFTILMLSAIVVAILG